MGGDTGRIVNGRFVAAAASCFFMTVVFFAHFTAIPSYSIDVLGTDAALAGFVAGIFIVGDIAGRILLGGSLWRWGPNKLCFVSMALGTGISVLYFLTTDVLLLCAIGLIHGFTYGVAELSVFARVSADLPPESRGKGLGYFTLSYSLASAVGPFLSIYLINEGLYDEIFVLGLVASAGSAVAALCMGRDGRMPVIEKSQTPRSGSTVISVLPISMVVLVFLISYSGVLTFIAPYGLERGIENYTLVFYVVLSVATVVSRVCIMGRYDRVGPDRILVPLLVLYALGMVLLGLAPFGFTILISAFTVGLALATLQAASQVMAVEGLDAREQGLPLATVQIFIDLSYIIGPVANGAVSSSVGYSGCYMLMGAVGAVSLVMYLITCSGWARRRSSENGSA